MARARYVIHLWEVPTGKELRRLEGPWQDFITNILFSPDGKQLSVFGSARFSDGKRANWMFSVLEVDTGKEVHRLNVPTPENPLQALSPNGKMLAWTDWPTSTIHLCDMTTGQELRSLAGYEFESPWASRQTARR